MKKFLLIAAFVAPFLINTVAKAQDDDTAKKTKTKKKHSKKTEKNADGSGKTTETTEKTTETKPADAPAP